jgi:hypothetical protein
MMLTRAAIIWKLAQLDLENSVRCWQQISAPPHMDLSMGLLEWLLSVSSFLPKWMTQERARGKIAMCWFLASKVTCCRALVAHTVILATQEAEIKRVMVWRQSGQIVRETLSPKYLTQKGLVTGSRCRPRVQASVPQKRKVTCCQFTTSH